MYQRLRLRQTLAPRGVLAQPMSAPERPSPSIPWQAIAPAQTAPAAVRSSEGQSDGRGARPWRSEARTLIAVQQRASVAPTAALHGAMAQPTDANEGTHEKEDRRGEVGACGSSILGRRVVAAPTRQSKIDDPFRIRGIGDWRPYFHHQPIRSIPKVPDFSFATASRPAGMFRKSAHAW